MSYYKKFLKCRFFISDIVGNKHRKLEHQRLKSRSSRFAPVSLSQYDEICLAFLQPTYSWPPRAIVIGRLAQMVRSRDRNQFSLLNHEHGQIYYEDITGLGVWTGKGDLPASCPTCVRHTLRNIHRAGKKRPIARSVYALISINRLPIEGMTSNARLMTAIIIPIINSFVPV